MAEHGEGHTMKQLLGTTQQQGFSLDQTTLTMSVQQAQVRILLVGPEKTPYFRCNDAAQVLGYSNYYKAVAKHVRPRQMSTLSELQAEHTPVLGGPLQADQNELKTKYMTESGLYRLIARSKLPFAEAFQDWVTYIATRASPWACCARRFQCAALLHTCTCSTQGAFLHSFTVNCYCMRHGRPSCKIA